MAIGAGVGAAIGAATGRLDVGTAVGAGGLLLGASEGARVGAISAGILQWRYDMAYVQCMYAKGHQVPGMASPRRPVMSRHRRRTPHLRRPRAWCWCLLTANSHAIERGAAHPLDHTALTTCMSCGIVAFHPSRCRAADLFSTFRVNQLATAFVSDSRTAISKARGSAT